MLLLIMAPCAVPSLCVLLLLLAYLIRTILSLLCLCAVESLSITKAAAMSSSLLQENEKSLGRKRTQHVHWQPQHVSKKSSYTNIK